MVISPSPGHASSSRKNLDGVPWQVTSRLLRGRVAANILKFVPGMGTVAGGTISAATAGVLTTTLGEIYIATLVALSDTSGGLPSQEDIAKAFKQRLTRN
jgi:uncharacterized protein (DUF697 family)